MTSEDSSAIPDYSRMTRLDDRAFVVIGAGHGMGRQSAHALASQGARVLCVDLDGDRAREVAVEVNGIACAADVTSADEVQRVIATAQREFGALHDICLRHAFHVVKYGGRALMAEGGSLIFIASVSGINSSLFHGAYGAAKAGLMSLVRTAGLELRPHNIRVNAIAPGGVATPRRTAATGTPAELLADGALTSFASTADIAASVLFFATDLSRHITGQTLVIDGGAMLRYAYDIAAVPAPPGQSMGERPETWTAPSST
ncbi:MAG: SDR family oxidoreductase [Acidimicrobiales bacterium]